LGLNIQGKDRPGRAFPIGNLWYIITHARYVSMDEAIRQAESEAQASGKGVDHTMIGYATPDGYWRCTARRPGTDEDYRIIKEEQEIFYTKYPEKRPAN